MTTVVHVFQLWPLAPDLILSRTRLYYTLEPMLYCTTWRLWSHTPEVVAYGVVL